MNLKLYIKKPKKLIRALGNRNIFNWMPDKLYLKLLFWAEIGKKLNLENPQSFNEKLQWLKLYDRNPEYTKMVDKYEVRSYISEKIGEEYLIPLLGVWDKFEEIDFASLPNQFVLKCTHDSGGLVICKDKATLDMNAAKKKINKCLKRNFYKITREWPYKNVKPRIIAEKFMTDSLQGDGLADYKVLCFGGEAKLIELHLDRYSKNHIQNMYDINWNNTGITQGGYNTTEKVVEKPSQLNKIIELSQLLSKGIRHVRIDWYVVEGKIYFGEITFFDGSGFATFDDEKDDLYIGSLIDLEQKI